ncbi:MAG: 5-formyltetrahydrofolate cyclo-ligase [Bdellovibrionales bacterium]|nr:5-formyltetrahydrofolate cyclo-ligase [Bdellovibrionales bacterium]
MGTKSDLRKILKLDLASLTDQEHFDLSLKVAKNLSELLNRLNVIPKHLLIGVFAPIEKEPVWFLDMDEALQKFMAYPAFAEGTMIFRKTQMSELVIKEDFGVKILGPRDSAPEITPEIVIVPGLGFDEDGKRLGRGKGFYDRYLENKSVIKIGVAFDMQMKKDIPKDPHDVLMDFVVTDQKIYVTK